NKATQAITFGALPGGKRFGDASFDIAATGGASGNPVEFTGSGACSVTGTTVSIDAAGLCLITASQAGNANFNDAAPVPQSTDIAKAGQAIVFGALADRTVGDAPFTVSATGGASGMPVTFGAAGACTVADTTVTLTAAGQCTITAS